MEKTEIKRKPDRELINHYIERLKSGEAIENIYDEIVKKEQHRHSSLESKDWLDPSLYNLAFACIACDINLDEKEGLDYLKQTIGYVNTELLIYPMIHYANDYLAQLPNAYAKDKDGFTRAGILNATVNSFINDVLPHRCNLSFDEKIVVDDSEYREKYPMFYVGKASELYIFQVINEFIAYASFILGELFQKSELPEDYLRLCGETLVDFGNYMLNKLKNFAIFLTDDQYTPELPYYTLAEFIDSYNICKHKVQMRQLKDFLVKVGTYYNLIGDKNGISLKDICDHGDAIAYAYAKKKSKDGKTPKSGIPEIDIAIAKMKKR